MRKKVFYAVRVLFCFTLVFSVKLRGNEKMENENKIAEDSQNYPFMDYTLPMEQRIEDLISRLTLDEKISQLHWTGPGIPRLGIPTYNWWNEALHGVGRAGRATVFPQVIGMAAAFDRDLIFRVADAISDEGRVKFNAALRHDNRSQYLGLTYWSPNINIFRDPRWGRGMETWGEDPFLTGELASQFVKGLQGNHPKYLKAAACAKHYVVHSGPEGDRHHFDAAPPLTDFYETYLPAFKKLVKDAKVEGVMSAYNRTYGIPCSASRFLLYDILRKQWGFEGYIVSDCWALMDFHQGHAYTKDVVESAAGGVKAGINLNCGDAYKFLGESVERGLVTEKDINDVLAVLMRTRFRLGLFDPPSANPYNMLPDSIVGSRKHKELAREAAQKSIVLLKNNGVLPLSKKTLKNLMVIGPTANDANVLLGNYHGVSDQGITIVQGIASKIDLGCRMEYREGFLLDRKNINEIGWAVSEAKSADATIAVMGLNTSLEGEEGEAIASPFKSDRTDIKLPGEQLHYLKELRKNDGKPLIVVLTGGSPLELSEVHEIADAVLFVWYPGEQGGLAAADVIFGDVNPSGKLPLTFPKSIDQLPPYEDYAMAGRTYRYMTAEPFYPFGYGLSYTSFEFSDIFLTHNEIEKGGSSKLSVTLKNTGSYTGDEVIQLYTAHANPGKTDPVRSLKAFERVALEPGESRTVAFDITPEMLAVMNEKGEAVINTGTYRIYAGGSSPSTALSRLGLPHPVFAELKVKP